MTKDEALDLALEALQQWNAPSYKRNNAITAIKQARLAPVQDIGVEQDERVFARIEARKNRDAAHKETALKPLTDEEIDDIWNRYCDEMGEASINDAYDIARAIEAAHGIKENT